MPLSQYKNFASRDVARYLYNLFWARHDVYAKKFIYQSGPRKGKKGYAPKCVNFWKAGLCEKLIARESGARTHKTCEECTHSKYSQLTKSVILRHLCGQISIGIYPLLQNDTCWFCVIDIDDHAAKDPEDSCLMTGSRVVQAGDEFGVNVFLERSGGGRGAHCWIFFKQAIPATLARELLYGLIVAAGLPDPGSIEIFPKQNEARKLGNLIALPFQGPERVAKNYSVFVDPDSFEPINPCHMALPPMVEGRLSLEDTEHVVASLKKAGALKGWRGWPRRSQKSISSKNKKASTRRFRLVPNPIDSIYNNCAAVRKIRDRAEGEDGLTHEERLALASVIHDLPKGQEEIHRIIGLCPDYDHEYTQQQIESLQVPPWTCEAFQTHLLCDGMCERMLKRGKRSPVAFAFQGKRSHGSVASQIPVVEVPPEQPEKPAIERFFERFGRQS